MPLFDDRHLGQVRGTEREGVLISLLPDVASLLKADRVFFKIIFVFLHLKFSSGSLSAYIINLRIAYSNMTAYKQRIFHFYFARLHAIASVDAVAAEMLSSYTQYTLANVCCMMANIQNEPTSHDECWIANDKLRTSVYPARPSFSINK